MMTEMMRNSFLDDIWMLNRALAQWIRARLAPEIIKYGVRSNGQ